MADYPYLVLLSFALAASGAGSPSFQSPAGESYDLKSIRFVSTGAFSITAIRDTEGRFYSNATVSNPITSTMLQNSNNANLSLSELAIPITLPPTVGIIIDLLDVSAAPNTVRMIFNAVRHAAS